MRQLAVDEGHAYPIGAKVICRDFYVDDMISGANSIGEAREILHQTRELLAKGNFKLRKWCSSERRVLADVAAEDRENLLQFHDGTNVTKTLGLVWEPDSDIFIFSFSPLVPQSKLTKRAILATIARLYDPLGLIGPIITKAKIFMQQLWKEKLHWDEGLPQSLHYTWKEICEEYTLVDRFSFDIYVLIPGSSLEVHAFCDASLLAYDVCVYVRAGKDGTVRTNLLCSKSRVAPLKTLTIPKLEL
ncbi:PREDICTED: uncharacterized protein LOC108370006 [Rhagoletis zephyria]|uniref:uncharacterized protein LOC108370006 n=1 Tax=Rhagoletis zephyria TaxID=28612 RepID=UPI0008112D98|nr:PREDICTED: uncharacterized protein LOC108370006 [Rhagoletis zephyria]